MKKVEKISIKKHKKLQSYIGYFFSVFFYPLYAYSKTRILCNSCNFVTYFYNYLFNISLLLAK